jgi:hypothetical protein
MFKVLAILILFIIVFVVGAVIFTVGLGFCAWACGCEKSLPTAIKGAFKRIG